MKIAHIVFSFNTGGIETMLTDIINEQVRKHEVFLFVVNRSYSSFLLSKIDRNAHVFLINRKEASKYPHSFIKLNCKLLQISPNVIHCHQHSIIQFLLLRRKSVLTVHDTGITAKYFHKYRKIFAISEAVKYDIESRSKITAQLVYNGINFAKVEKKNHFQVNQLRIVQIGRLDYKKKGQFLLLEALKILVHERKLDVHLDFIGSTPFSDDLAFLKKSVFNLQLDGHVTFKGNWTRTEIYTQLKNYSLLVQPSLYEGFGLTVLEAMAAKVPVLVSNIEGPMEIIQNGNLGDYFEKGDAEDLAEKIIIICESYPEKISKAEKAYKEVQSKFSIEKTAEMYLKNYLPL